MNLQINNKTVAARLGQTILDVAREHGIKIPSLCYHPDLDIKANCRVCAVEIKGSDKLATACSMAAQAGMEIYTDSPRAKRARIEKRGTLWRRVRTLSPRTLSSRPRSEYSRISPTHKPSTATAKAAGKRRSGRR